MMEVSKLSSRYCVRKLTDRDVDDVLALCTENVLFYQYCEAEPTREQILRDMYITPPGIDPSLKHFVGFYQEHKLIAVMDIIDGYPTPEIAYFGFFMMDPCFQGKQLGSAIISEVEAHLKTIGITAVRLGINKGNPQSTHFWKKNGFIVFREVNRNGWTLLEAEKRL